MNTRLAMGEGSSFATHLLALSSLVALLTGSQALREMVLSTLPPTSGSGPALLVASFLGEVDSLLSAWLVPVWLLTTASAFVVTYSSARAFEETSELISGLGGSVPKLSSLYAVRVAMLAGLSFVLGVSSGLVGAQVVFRVFLVSLGAQYYVPAVSPAGLGVVALLSFTALLLGSGVSAAIVRRWP